MNLRTLGGLELVGARFTQPKPLLLLAYLALNGPQTRAFLAELFWPQGARRKSLSMTLTRLRGAVGDALCADEARVWTTLGCDAQDLLARLEQGDPAAADGYAGAFLDGLDLALPEELEAWVYGTRERLGERVQGALLERAERAAGTGDYGGAARLAERSYRLPGAPPAEPETLERLYRLLAAGRSLHAPAARAELAEYGVTLSLTTEAARALLPPEAPPLPTRATSFVGREPELAELGRAFARPACRLVTLLGPAGAGKTRLALRFAHDQRAAGRYPDGVVFASLETLHPGTFVPRLARQLGCSLENGGDPVVQLGAFLASKRLLLILDNFEHLAGEALTLAQLLGRAPGLALLVTSRVRLRLEEEHLVTLGGLPYPAGDPPLGEARTFGAVELFAERARQLRADFSLAGELGAVLDLCRLVGGLPLGLELAAGWVRVMTCADIARSVRENLDLLESPNPDRPERHRSLRAAFETSWRLLSEPERGVLGRLAVFPGSFTREAAAVVAGATLPVLAVLVDRSLVGAQAGRFALHPLVAQYAREKLEADPEGWRAAREAHAAYYLRLAEAQRAVAARGRQEEALRVLGPEWAGLRAAFAHLLDERGAEALGEWLELFELLHDMRGSYAEALAFLNRAETALDAAEAASGALGSVRVEQAWFELRLGRYERAKASVRAALKGPLGARWRVTGLNVSGVLERRTGDYAAAREACETGLALARDLGDYLVVAKLLATLADVEEVQGDLGAAEAHLSEAVSLYERRGQVLGLVRNLNNLGWLYLVAGRGRGAGDARAGAAPGPRGRFPADDPLPAQ